jgi:hypothetical protein
MSIKLWLDDERDPSNPTIKDLFGSNGDEIWVKTVADAKDYISNHDVVSISFDHDLGTELTGYDLAKWIEEKAFHKQIKPIELRIHSMNTIGNKNIQIAIDNCNKYWEI